MIFSRQRLVKKRKKKYASSVGRTRGGISSRRPQLVSVFIDANNKPPSVGTDPSIAHSRRAPLGSVGFRCCCRAAKKQEVWAHKYLFLKLFSCAQPAVSKPVCPNRARQRRHKKSVTREAISCPATERRQLCYKLEYSICALGCQPCIVPRGLGPIRDTRAHTKQWRSSSTRTEPTEVTDAPRYDLRVDIGFGLYGGNHKHFLIQQASTKNIRGSRRLRDHSSVGRGDRGPKSALMLQ